MALRVRIPEQVSANVRAFRPPIVEDVETAIMDLSERPRLGTPQIGGPYDGSHAYEFRISRPPATRRFALLYRFDENELEVLDFGVFEGTPAVLRPAAWQIGAAS